MSLASQQSGFEHAPWLEHYPECVPHQLEYPEDPTWWLLAEAARNDPERIACRYYDESLTYAELYDRAQRAATLFREQGLAAGDRVGLLLPNMPEYLVAAYGVWLAGGSVVSLSPLMVAEEVSALLETTGCRMVVALDMLVPLAYDGEHRPEKMFVVTLGDRLPRLKQIGYAFLRLRKLGWRPYTGSIPLLDFDKELESRTPLAEPVQVSQDDAAFILATGGTTGHPKAVTLSYRNLLANAWQLHHWAGRRSGKDVILAVIPFFHSYGLSTCVTMGVAMGATLVLHHRFQPGLVLDLIERERPTIFPAVPAMLPPLNELLREHPRDLKSLMFVISGGAPLDEATADEFNRHSGAKVVEGYGLSEASPVTHVGPIYGDVKPGTIGLPLPDTEARIVDAQSGTETLPVGAVGELVVRGPQVMLGYWEDPEATAEAIRDGWLFTGDLAKYDDEGYFTIVDRKKDLIITSGFNVYPGDVESVLRRFDGVEDVAVIGVPDGQRGELVKAVLAVKDEASFDRKAFDEFLREHLGRHKQPKIVEVLEGDLPRNFLGKVLRRKLRGQAAGDDASETEGSTGAAPVDETVTTADGR